MSDEAPIIGIDLGTTYSLVSVLGHDGPRVLPNAIGELLTPSAVSVLDDGSFVVGAAAKARATTHAAQTALAFKRDMGTDRRVELGGKSLSAPELSALVLGSLKRDAEAFLGRPVHEAVITVPAYFGDAQRQATKDAGEIAGLKVERIVNEPTAAALAYGLHQRDREVRAVVLDLGGGTFDVTVLEIIEGVVEVQSSSGDVRLGGDDFDRALAEHVRAKITKQHGADPERDPTSWARVISAFEEAKRRLSQASETTIALPTLTLSNGAAPSIQLELSVGDAEHLWAPLLERMRGPITRALADAKASPRDIEDVLLVGGSTRMPCVAKLAAQIFGRLPLRTLPPDEAVGLGAAVQAALKQGHSAVEDMVVTDVAPFSLGIATASSFGTQLIEGMFSPILERGTVIPASREKRFSTTADNQREIEVEVYQGEHSLCRDNRRLGQLVVAAIPAAPAGHQSIDVRFTYDLNGILEVDATVVSTRATSTLVLERTPGRMSKAQVAQARKDMARLKLHPREALPNTVALSRAEALFVDLLGDEREFLSMEMKRFRGALEQQDPRTIDLCRDRLSSIVASLRQSRR